MKKVFLDTETTGIDPKKGHRIVEIAAVAYSGRHPIPYEEGGIFHRYVNPQRDIDKEAQNIHGLDIDFLSQQPTFEDIVQPLIDFLTDADLYIHNAKFDVNFINAELERLDLPLLQNITKKISCTLEWSRKNNTGIGSHSLDSLCHHFGVSTAMRASRHSAIIDTQLLAQVYFLMIRQQISLHIPKRKIHTSYKKNHPLPVIRAKTEEIEAHHHYLATMETDTTVMPIFNRNEK